MTYIKSIPSFAHEGTLVYTGSNYAENSTLWEENKEKLILTTHNQVSIPRSTTSRTFGDYFRIMKTTTGNASVWYPAQSTTYFDGSVYTNTTNTDGLGLGGVILPFKIYTFIYLGNTTGGGGYYGGIWAGGVT